jgi:hypothetical protein
MPSTRNIATGETKSKRKVRNLMIETTSRTFKAAWEAVHPGKGGL